MTNPKNRDFGTFLEDTHSITCNWVILGSGWDLLVEDYIYLQTKLFSLQIPFASWSNMGNFVWSIYLNIYSYNNIEWYIKHMILFNINICIIRYKVDCWKNLFYSDVLRNKKKCPFSYISAISLDVFVKRVLNTLMR